MNLIEILDLLAWEPCPRRFKTTQLARQDGNWTRNGLERHRTGRLSSVFTHSIKQVVISEIERSAMPDYQFILDGTTKSGQQRHYENLIVYDAERTRSCYLRDMGIWNFQQEPFDELYLSLRVDGYLIDLWRLHNVVFFTRYADHRYYFSFEKSERCLISPKRPPLFTVTDQGLMATYPSGINTTHNITYSINFELGLATKLKLIKFLKRDFRRFHMLRYHLANGRNINNIISPE